jgi:hypothetical protein
MRAGPPYRLQSGTVRTGDVHIRIVTDEPGVCRGQSHLLERTIESDRHGNTRAAAPAAHERGYY